MDQPVNVLLAIDKPHSTPEESKWTWHCVAHQLVRNFCMTLRPSHQQTHPALPSLGHA